MTFTKALTVVSKMRRMTQNLLSSKIIHLPLHLCHFLNKYFHRADDEVEDEVDSDFSIDENDEPVSDHEEEGPKRSRGAINTKAYKVLKL